MPDLLENPILTVLSLHTIIDRTRWTLWTAAIGGGDEMRALLYCLLLLLPLLLLVSGGEAQTLAAQEVEALQQIGSKLRKDWDFSVDPCSRSRGWINTIGKGTTRVSSNVTCDCSFNNSTLCHVISLELIRQNLTGVLPEAMVNLTYLRFLDLSRNVLTGSIPSSWSSLQVFNLSLHGNHLSGKIPKELGSMPVVKSLQFEGNQFEGPLPPELGNLRSLERLFISANYITGELPLTFAMLTNMTDFRIDGNNISGKIPDFIHKWSRIDRIDMQGTSMEGPIPSSFSLLKTLTTLRVTDLSGKRMTFPPLQNAVNLTELVLRNCLIDGEIPPYLGNMMLLKVLDLSFNNLTGQIPNFENLETLSFLYLTNNMLTGEIPPWMLTNKASNKNMDISYNNFSGDPPNDCQEGNVNMVESFLSSKDNSIRPCLRKDIPCSTKPLYSSLFINCGGNDVRIGDREYAGDSTQIGTSEFLLSDSGSWAYSSTGDFVGNEDADYIARNSSVLNMTHPELYTEARLSPLSLRYYGLCLENGNYSVDLHFSEIVFTADQTFSSTGRRFFDILIQGNKVLKDFNIEYEAGGPGHVIIKNFTTAVTDNTLEIQLYWAGKGTTAIPERGIYGPLISAISVTRDTKHNKLSVGATIGITAASVITFLLLVLCFIGCHRRKYCKNLGILARFSRRGNSAEFQAQSQYYFSMKQIEDATRSFDSSNKIGEGGFGSVYKGTLSDGTVIAVKQLSSVSRQGNREFLNEIGMISALRHPNLVRLYGCCIEGNELLLIYEYLENNSLGRALFGRKEHQLKLNWPARCAISLGIARGLAYLHEESRLRIVHRDIKPTNILLDKNLNPKISDFGLAKLDEDTKFSTRIAGTVGYMAPEYATRGYLTDKADVYSFGVVMLEIVSGKSNTDFMPHEKLFYLLDQAKILLKQDRLLELVDPNLGSNYSKEDALRMLQVSLLCTNSSHELRPAMSAVVSMLVGQAPVPAPEHDSRDDWGQTSLQKLSSRGSPTCVLKDGQSTDISDSLCSGEELIPPHSSSRSC